jgi:glutathione-regulated potassium-efflux system ancillary protein KefF
MLHGAHKVDEAEVAAHESVYVQRLATYPDWPELAELPECIACEVPQDARPADDEDAPLARIAVGAPSTATT